MLVCSAKELMNEYEFVQSFIPNFNPRPQYVCGLLTPALSATRARKSMCVCVCVCVVYLKRMATRPAKESDSLFRHLESRADAPFAISKQLLHAERKSSGCGERESHPFSP